MKVADVGAFQFLAAAGTLFFVGVDREHGAELWKTDGTAEGTTLVRDIRPGVEVTAWEPPLELTALGGQVLFAASDGVSGYELWRSDGTEGGTVRVKDIAPGEAGASPRWLAAVGKTLFFSADDGAGGRELWNSDGTEAGTMPVKDIFPGATGSSPRGLRAVGGRVLFAANDGVAGVELWQSDGTDAGTRLVQDIAPGPASSDPLELRLLGGRVYFTANDGVHGREPWALAVEGGAQGVLAAPAPVMESVSFDFRPQRAGGHALDLGSRVP